MKRIILCCVLLLCYASGHAFVKEVRVRQGVNVFSSTKDTISIAQERYLAVPLSRSNEVLELSFLFKDSISAKQIRLVPSASYRLIDSLIPLSDTTARMQIQTSDLNRIAPIAITLQTRSGKEVSELIRIYPLYTPVIQFFPTSESLYLGEEKVFDMETATPDWFRATTSWRTQSNYRYRISKEGQNLRLRLIPTVTGEFPIEILPPLAKEYLDSLGKISKNIAPLKSLVKVKASRLQYVAFDKKELTYDENTRREGIDVIIDGAKGMSTGRTYRLEEQEAPGGALIAEVFVKNALTSDRVLGLMRPYNFHRAADGVLYLKDGDDTKYITNMDISPKVQILSLKVLRNGKNWTDRLQVYPGETLMVRVEGISLHKAKFAWDGAIIIGSDTILNTDKRVTFRLRIPIQINTSSIDLTNNGDPTGQSLRVGEYQKPHKLDFVKLSYGNGFKPLTEVEKTTVSEKALKNLVFTFDNAALDVDGKMCGKQFLSMDVKYYGPNNELIESRTVENIVVCPGDKSPRFDFYQDGRCNNTEVIVNDVMQNKTYNLTDFSRVEVTVRHQKDKYEDPIFEKNFNVVVQRPMIFDTDLSFPAGLLIQNIGGSSSKSAFTDNLGGISLALIGQIKFTDPEKIGRLKPFRCGVGFLAINAFNFSETAKRDLAIVALASYYPLSRRKVFNLPIHVGAGYKIQSKQPFVMLSPGISITF